MVKRENNIILFLGAAWIATLIALGISMYGGEYKDVIVDQAENVVQVNLHDVIRLQGRERAIIEQRKQDSIKSVQQRLRFIREINRLHQKLNEVNLKYAKSQDLDSIRGFIYGDSLYYDTLYAMPISQARDVLESKLRESTRIEQVEVLSARVDSLESDCRRLSASMMDQIRVGHEIAEKFRANSESLEVVNDHYKKQLKKQKRSRIWQSVVASAAGFGIGSAMR